MDIRNELFHTVKCEKLKPGYKIILWLVSLLFIATFLLQANAFLTKNEPLNAEILVVEGWLPDYALRQVVEICKAEKYRRVITAGGPLKTGSFLKEYQDHAHLAKATLVALGMDEGDVTAVEAPDVERDRTFHSALAVKDWLAGHDIRPAALNLVSLGPHARRSRLLYQKVFKGELQVGSIAIAPENYDPDRWYTTSEGVRSTLSELIAYMYVLLFG